MSVITDLTRMWLTRSTKPFTFLNEYDEILDYANCDNLGLYVHIPFCEKIYIHSIPIFNVSTNSAGQCYSSLKSVSIVT